MRSCRRLRCSPLLQSLCLLRSSRAQMHLKELLSELVREANQPGPVHKSLHKPRAQNAKASA